MTFVALWRLFFMTFVALWHLSHYDVCHLWRLSPYDVCRIMTFVALWRLSFMTLVALWRLSPIMTFVAYMVCRSIDQPQRVNFRNSQNVLYHSTLVFRGIAIQHRTLCSANSGAIRSFLKQSQNYMNSKDILSSKKGKWHEMPKFCFSI